MVFFALGNFPMILHTSPLPGSSSPWGLIERVTPLGPDASAVITPSHGGIWVTPAALAAMPADLRRTAYSRDGWFEEDCDWCIPYLALGLNAHDSAPDRDGNLQAARRTMQAYHPEHAGLIASNDVGVVNV
jgi:hypothetical protein